MIDRNDFSNYLKVQKSGITNMFAVHRVAELTGMTKDQIFDIMVNYSKYSKDFGLTVKNVVDN
jgi:hypothetical protein